MSLVGSYVALSKPLAAAFPVLLLAWMRFGIGALAMLTWLKKPADEPPLTPQTRGLLFLQSLLGNFLFTVCMIYGVSLTSACAVIGIALFSLSKPEHPAQSGSALEPDNAIYLQWLGYALLLCASVCEGAYSVIGKKLTGAMGPKRITSLINLWGFLLSMPFGLYLAWGFDFKAVPWGIWLLLLFYALAACMWTVWLWMTGLRAVPAAQGGVFTVLLPVSAALVGVLVLGERFTPLQLLAFGLALASVVLATLPSRLALRVGRGAARPDD